MLKYVVFDFDGTLVNSLHVIVDSYNAFAEKYQAKRVDYQDIEYLKSLSMQERSKFVNFKLYKFPLLAIDVYRLYKQRVQEIHPVADMKELLQGLHAQGIKLAIISTNAKEIIEQFLRYHQIDVFDEVICSNHLFGKDKEIRRFLKEKNLQASDIVYVGDEIRDIIAGKKNAVPVIWVGWGYDLLENVERYGPDYKADTPQDIARIIQAI